MRPRLLSLPVLAILAATLGLAAPAVAGGADDARPRVPTVTRLVQLFATLESELMAALQAGDAAAIGKLLADDFELRGGAQPGNPLPRAEWLRQAQGQAAAPFEQIAVHDYGNAAIVSYLLKRKGAPGAFVVDVWRRSGDTWQLAVRYASPAGAP